jgi:lactoylglutathione lyase
MDVGIDLPRTKEERIVLSLNLLVLKTTEPDRLVRFYERLGISFVREKHGGGSEHHSGDVGGLTLEIYPANSSDETTAGTRLGFRVSSLSHTLAAMGTDLDVLSPPENTAWGWRAVLADPAGHKVELAEG